MTSTEDSYFCMDCADWFSVPVWHCPNDDHHWPEGKDPCGNCYEDRPDSAELAEVHA